MKFNTPKEEPKAKAKGPTVEVTVQARPVSALQYRSDSMLIIKEFMELLNHGSAFAQHCSIMHGIGGIEGILILRSILDTAELDPKSSALDNMLQDFKDSEASELMFLLVDYSDTVRHSVDATIKAYFNSFKNDFKPEPSGIAEAIKGAVKVGSIDELVKAIEATLNLKGKK